MRLSATIAAMCLAISLTLIAPRGATAGLPYNLEHAKLAAAYTRYLQIAADGGWSSLPENLFLIPGREVRGRFVAALPALCTRLRLTGDLAATDVPHGCETYGETGAYDASLEAAVKTFQTRHGLVVDGIVGPRTTAALNLPVTQRLEQLRLNLERWDELAGRLEPTHVRVNVAAYRLVAVEYGTPVLSMPVVVGKPRTPTPLFSDAISYLVFRPYWNVPRSITHNELLPKIAANPSYLRKRNLEVVDGWTSPARVVDPSTIAWEQWRNDFPYRLRQRPGAHNALGLVKFMFPNRYNVYLHDTPAKYRFNARRRAFSHGCVRVADPVGLATWLLRSNDDWSADALASAMRRGPRRVVRLAEPVPVHLVYLTTWTDGGRVHFAPDVYGYDRPEGEPTL